MLTRLRFPSAALPSFILLSLALLSEPGLAHAATLNVPAQYATIQAGIDAAHDGDTVLVADGTYTGPGNRDIDFDSKNITVASQHSAAKTIIDCQGTSSVSHRGFYIHNGEASAVISGLTIKNGYAAPLSSVSDNDSGLGGGICIIGASCTVQNCILSSNMAFYNGGGMYNGNRGGDTVTMSACIFTHNAAANSGGGMYNANYDTSTITINDCTISGNTATYGGGIFNIDIGNSGSGTITLVNCVVNGNTATQFGGGVDNNNEMIYGSISLAHCTVSGNTAMAGGGVANTGSQNSSNPDFNIPSHITITDTIVYGDTGTEVASDSFRALALDITYCDVQDDLLGTGNFNVDPLFVNAAAGDFHLTPVSPVRGRGIAVSSITTDKDGKTRSNPPAIGAYEYVGPHQWTATGIAASAGGVIKLLWDKTNGAASIWNIDGSAITDFPAYGLSSTGWTAKAIATAPNGLNHLLWTNTNGAASVSTIAANGSTTYSLTYGPFKSWGAHGITVSPDGLTHLLWTKTDGHASLWNIAANGTVTYSPTYGPYAGWTARSLSASGDGGMRLLWTNTDGRAGVWTIAPTGIIDYGATYGPFAEWSAKAVGVGTDNVTHLLWDNADGRASYWSITAGGAVTYSPTYGPF